MSGLTRKCVIVTAAAVLVCGAVAVALLKPPSPTLAFSFKGYETNVHEVVRAVAIISNTGPRLIWIGIRSKSKPGTGRYDQTIETSLAPFGMATFECQPSCHIAAEYRKSYHGDYPDTLSELVQFWLDCYILRTDRRTNVQTVHFDVP